LAACAGAGTGDITADQVALAPLPTVGGVGVLPSTVPPEREPLVPVTRPVQEDGTPAELVGDKVIDNRLLVIGDSIMALFPEAAEDAVKAAIAMRLQLAEYNRDRMTRGEQAIEMGIGIHTGELMLGTIGEAERMETRSER